MSNKVIDLETEKARRRKAARFHTIAEHERSVVIDLKGTFTPAAARLYANAILQRCDAIEFYNSQDPQAE